MIKLVFVLLAIQMPFIIQPSLTLAQLEAQPETEEPIPKGDVVNSKYLSVPEHRYRQGDFSDQITGVVVNNSTQEVSGVSVDAALYDSENKLITMAGAGFADVSTLPPGDNSAFSISLFNVGEEDDHYTLFPSGTP